MIVRNLLIGVVITLLIITSTASIMVVNKLNDIQSSIENLKVATELLEDDLNKKVHIKSDKLGITATEIKAKLDSGYPRIWVSDIDANTIGLSIHTLNEEEDEIVANRINAILIGY